MSGVYIPDMEMPKNGSFEVLVVHDNGIVAKGFFPNENELTNAIFIPDHGRLIDADALIEDMKRQCREVFKIDAVSQDDFWITRNEAYNERLLGTWCESFYEYLKTAPTIIPAEEGE